MPRPKSKGRRVNGPHALSDGRWRLVVIDPKGGNRPAILHYSTEDEAQRTKALVEENWKYLDRVTIEQAMAQYAKYLIKKGNKPDSRKQTLWRIGLFFPKLDMAVADLTPPECAVYYDADEADFATHRKTYALPMTWVPLTARLVVRGKASRQHERPISVDYHRNALAETKSFLGWCVEQKWISENPLVAVKGIGKRKHGKPQLRIDEARRWMAAAMERIREGDEGALAAAMTLLMAHRAQEITKRRVRDLDDGGSILWVENGKTARSNGAVEVPAVLQPFLRALADGRAAEEYLFRRKDGGPRWRDWPRKNVQRICQLAKVPTVCAHAMRGLHSSVLFERGACGDAVADALRHENVTTTKQSYATKESVRTGMQRRAVKTFLGGEDAHSP